MSVQPYRMKPLPVYKPAPPIVQIIEWVRTDPDEATKVGASLVILGLALIAVAAIFRGDK